MALLLKTKQISPPTPCQCHVHTGLPAALHSFLVNPQQSLVTAERGTPGKCLAAPCGLDLASVEQETISCLHGPPWHSQFLNQPYPQLRFSTLCFGSSTHAYSGPRLRPGKFKLHCAPFSPVFPQLPAHHFSPFLTPFWLHFLCSPFWTLIPVCPKTHQHTDLHLPHPATPAKHSHSSTLTFLEAPVAFITRAKVYSQSVPCTSSTPLPPWPLPPFKEQEGQGTIEEAVHR